jgi:hypothetical protein
MAQDGTVDLQEMVSLFRRGPDVGSWSWSTAEKHMNTGGELPSHSGAHRLNAFVAVGAPAERKYMAAIGPITHRSVSPNRSGHGYFIYDETNAYWEVTLADNIVGILERAKNVASELVLKAEKAIEQAHLPAWAEKRLGDWYSEIQSLLKSEFFMPPEEEVPDEALSQASKCLRHYTRAQVRARQILQAINPPKEWGVTGVNSNQ